MAKWNDIKNGVGRAADKTMKKASELADAAALRLKLKATGVKLSEKYETLGRLTYKQLKTERSQAEAIAKVIDDIDLLREKAKALRQRIEAEKEARAERPEDVVIEEEQEEEKNETAE